MDHIVSHVNTHYSWGSMKNQTTKTGFNVKWLWLVNLMFNIPVKFLSRESSRNKSRTLETKSGLYKQKYLVWSQVGIACERAKRRANCEDLCLNCELSKNCAKWMDMEGLLMSSWMQCYVYWFCSSYHKLCYLHALQSIVYCIQNGLLGPWLRCVMRLSIVPVSSQ